MKIWTAEIKELEKLYESHKGQLPDLEKELERLIKADDENMILLYSRRCLEVIIADLCECELKRPRKTEPLQGIIDKLHKEEKVPSHIIASMQSLNSLSTFGAHPKDFDPEQVKPVLNNLDIVIKWYLKYKESGTEIKTKPIAVIRQEVKSAENVKKSITISRKKLAGLIGGLVAVIAAVFAVLYFSNIIGKDKQIEELDKSIAVLPFRNLSNDTTQLYFSDGIVEAILDHLFKVGELKVISGTSTKRYRDTELSIREIAKELGVSSILEGSVQKIGNKVRITAQLIEAKTDMHLWSETYDKDLSDIFSIQTEVAQNVARELKATLTSEEKEHIKRNQTENPEAYNLYLQGRFFWNKRTKDGLNKSVEYFENAIKTDPNYALAYAGLADAYFIQAYWGWIPWIEGTAKSKELALRALDIDINLAEAHTVLGALLNYKEWKWEEARKELQLAVELNPNFVTAHHYYSELMDILRKNDEARKHINIAMQLDPFLPVLHVLSSAYFYHERKFKESLDECLVLEELDPEYSNRVIYWREYDIYLKQEEDLKALEALQTALFMDTLDVINSNIIKDVYNKSGVNGLWNWLIESELKSPNLQPLTLANRYVKIGKKEEALNWLEKAFENRSPEFPSAINNNPDYDDLRSEPRFQAIIKKMGLSEYQTPE
jgi:TolB-like protein